MSKTISGAYEAHLALYTTTIATCWKVTRRDAQVFAFTDHIENITFDAVTYLAATAYTASAIESSAGLNVDNLEVSGYLDAAAITEEDLLAGKWDFAEVLIFEVNYNDLSMGSMKLRRGWLGEVKSTDVSFIAELRGMMQRLQGLIGRVITPACNADVFDARCGLSTGSVTNGLVSSTITGAGATNNDAFSDTALTAATAWFDYGLVTFTGGLNDGLSMEVAAYTLGSPPTVTLKLPMPFLIQVGDTYDIRAGCDKTIATCRVKYNNVINFRGFPHVPGPGRLAGGI